MSQGNRRKPVRCVRDNICLSDIKYVAPVVIWRVSAASSAGRVSVWITVPDFLTCGGQPKSHQSPRMRAASCGLRRQREAGEEGIRLSERPAEECVHTCRSPAEERGEKMRLSERIQLPKPLHPTYVSLLTVPGPKPVYSNS